MQYLESYRDFHWSSWRADTWELVNADFGPNLTGTFLGAGNSQMAEAQSSLRAKRLMGCRMLNNFITNATYESFEIESNHPLYVCLQTESETEEFFIKKTQDWSEAVEDCLWDCLDLVDWTRFRCSAENLDEYATTVTDFISKCVEDCVPKKSVRVFPNYKHWMNHTWLKTRCAAFKSGDLDQYRKSRYELCKAIREAKSQYPTM
ncbi:uncharacterized protein LOC125452224 isoform X2 [Stegostoma tigrinum]|uniref:uncharacterized protein LOC125452224 isoform X2 n=1 Tax=Stegostoma tigrinum TaxID=3053191 RepID=UPI00202B17B7|nr:uncharacterized protein LOC125452224 isoform X2 [Stegostoma tigrinum]